MRCAAKSPDVNVKRRELLNASFYKYDCDQLGFLEAAQMRAFIRKMAVRRLLLLPPLLRADSPPLS